MNKFIHQPGKNDSSFMKKNMQNNEELLIKNSIENKMKVIISSFSEKERLVIALYFYENLTTIEIGKLMRLSESRISHMLDNSLAIINKKTFLEN